MRKGRQPGQHSGPPLRKEALGPGPAGNSQLCGSEKILRKVDCPSTGRGEGRREPGDSGNRLRQEGEQRPDSTGPGSQLSEPLWPRNQAAFVLSP